LSDRLLVVRDKFCGVKGMRYRPGVCRYPAYHIACSLKLPSSDVVEALAIKQSYLLRGSQALMAVVIDLVKQLCRLTRACYLIREYAELFEGVYLLCGRRRHLPAERRNVACQVLRLYAHLKLQRVDKTALAVTHLSQLIRKRFLTLRDYIA